MIDLYKFENELYSEGINYIGGVDEVGRGPLIGPVVACCCVLPKGFVLEGLTDSKKLTEKKRDEYYEYLIHNTIYGLGIIGAEKIDEVNIYEATKLAMYEAIANVRKQVNLEYVLIDAMPLDLDIPTNSIIKGDAKSISIAAASILAKVYRDRYMIKISEKYPQYNFYKNKGYGTMDHITKIKKYGTCDIHRISFLKKIGRGT